MNRRATGLLIVNADDLGLTPGVNAGIAEGYRHGIVTSTSVLAVAPAFEHAAALWRSGELHGLGVGVHFALVGEDPPLLASSEIPTLVDQQGRFAVSWRQLLARAVTGRIDADDVRRELAAQLQRVLDAGFVPTHVDTHQHLHLWPSIRTVVLELARQAGVSAIRVPRSAGRGPKGRGIDALAGALVRAAATAGLRHPAGFAGLDEAGGLDPNRLGAIVSGLGPLPSVEIGCHPGQAVDPARQRYRWGFDWPGELRALCDPGLREAVTRRGFRLGTFAEL
ncbi:MAG: carbohydrate deacetylase [Acidimicrobiales bacterium]